MRGYKAIISSLLLITLVLFSGACDKDDDGDKDITSLVSVSVSSGPTLDGSGNDAVWDEADAFVIPLGVSADYSKAFGEFDITLKSVHTSSDVYILASWTDPSGTESVDKNQLTYSNGAWSKSGNEDRLFFMFDGGDNGTEGANCATMCHVGDGFMRVSTSGGHVDVWHWKAHRTNPIGLTDDKWWNDGSGSDGDGRSSDSKTISAYKDNKTASGNFPLYAGPITDGSFIISQVGKAGGFSDLELFDSTDVNLQSNSYPGYFLDATAYGSGESRHDVESGGKYSNGVWTVEFKRALNTGHDDDAAFAVGSTTKFSIAVTDNSGGDHSGAGVFNFTIE